MTDILEELKELDKILKSIETKLATLNGTKDAKLEELNKYGFKDIEEAQEWIGKAKNELEERQSVRDKKFSVLRGEIEW